MDPSDLADYLAGDLDAERHARVTAALASDPELRGRLEAMRRADAALADLPPRVPPAGFEARLDQRLRDVLDEELDRTADPATVAPGSAAAAGPAHAAPADELAPRRRRGVGLGTLAAAAAGVALVVGLGTLGGDLMRDDQLDAADAPTTVDEAGEPEVAPADPGDGPTIVRGDGPFDDEALDAVVAAGELAELRDAELDPVTGREVAAAYQAGLSTGLTDDAEALPEPDARAEPGPDTAEEDGRADLDAEPEALDDPDAPGADAETFGSPTELTTREGEPLSDAEARQVNRCLDELLTSGSDAIPAYVAFGRFEDREALLFGLVTIEPDAGTFSRTELWVLERPSCEVLLFRQR